ncbi:MAG: VOC family protein [Eubacteriales bacterium]|nr:VOC family protein [Eubacteriales bacterium]
MPVHHIAIICTDKRKAEHFYRDLLGFSLIRETYREATEAREADWKIDLRGEGCQLELFIKPDAPARVSGPEACGLRHLAFATDDVRAAAQRFQREGVEPEPVRIDALTGKAFTFIRDPDGLPIELYEM